jgi:hypothetical protein
LGRLRFRESSLSEEVKHFTKPRRVTQNFENSQRWLQWSIRKGLLRLTQAKLGSKQYRVRPTYYVLEVEIISSKEVFYDFVAYKITVYGIS